jgi:hypothetical protein
MSRESERTIPLFMGCSFGALGFHMTQGGLAGCDATQAPRRLRVTAEDASKDALCRASGRLLREDFGEEARVDVAAADDGDGFLVGRQLVRVEEQGGGGDGAAGLGD